MRKCNVLWQAREAAKNASARGSTADNSYRKIRSYYDTMRDDGTHSITAVLDLPDAPTDIGRIYSDWASQHKVTEDMLVAVLKSALLRIEKSGDAAEDHEGRLQLLKQAAELYAFATEDMLVVPATVGVLLTECCVAVDSRSPPDSAVALRTATALYAKLREEKAANAYTTRFCPEFLGAMLRFRCNKTTQRVLADSETFDVKVPLDAIDLDDDKLSLETFLRNPVCTPEASLNLLGRLADTKTHTAAILPLLVKTRNGLAANPLAERPAVRVQALPAYVLARCGREALGLLRDVLRRSRCGIAADACEQLLAGGSDTESKEGRRKRAYAAIAQGQFDVAATLLGCESWFERRVRDVFASKQPEQQLKALLLDEQATRLIPLRALNALADFVSKGAGDVRVMRALSDRVLQRGGAFSDTTLLAYFRLVARETDAADATTELMAHAENSIVQPSAAYNGAVCIICLLSSSTSNKSLLFLCH